MTQVPVLLHFLHHHDATPVLPEWSKTSLVGVVVPLVRDAFPDDQHGCPLPVFQKPKPSGIRRISLLRGKPALCVRGAALPRIRVLPRDQHFRFVMPDALLGTTRRLTGPCTRPIRVSIIDGDWRLRRTCKLQTPQTKQRGSCFRTARCTQTAECKDTNWKAAIKDTNFANDDQGRRFATNDKTPLHCRGKR